MPQNFVLEEERVEKVFNLTLCTDFNYRLYRKTFQKMEDNFFPLSKYHIMNDTYLKKKQLTQKGPHKMPQHTFQ